MGWAIYSVSVKHSNAYKLITLFRKIEAELKKADALILPGVGSFKDAMVRLNETGLATMIHDYVGTGKPLLGICLGMQLLFEESEENGINAGLSLLPGRVVRFPGESEKGESYKVPHMGWNRLEWVNAFTDYRES